MSNHLPQVGAKSDKGPTRSANEDAFWVSDAHSPVQVISAAFYQPRHSGSTIQEALNDTILQANRAIYERAQAMNVSRMGCTLVAAVQHEGQLYVAHVGDARAYLLMENHLRRLTRDDTWVQKQVDAGIITYEEAAKHELRNIVTQVLGNKLEINVHQSATYELRAGDTYLLCSDGLHGVLSKEQLFKLMKDNPPQAAADALVAAAIEAQTRDNVTAVVVNSGVKTARRGKVPPPPRQESDPAGLPLWVKVTLVTVVLIFLGFLIYNF